MKTRILGRTGLEVSEIGFGAWAIGGNAHGNSLGPTDDATSRAAIDAALAAGVTFFDTADLYGHGRSEQLLGEALAGGRGGIVLATKAGADFTDPARIHTRYDGPYLRAALGRSLERLRTDHVDLFQLHDAKLDVIRAPETHEALARLKAEGLTRFVGASLHSIEEALAAIDCGVYDTIQVVMSVACQWLANRVAARARERGVGLIAREPLVQGYLSGKYGPAHVFPAGDVRGQWPADYRAYLDQLVAAMRRYFHERRKVDRPLAAIALQFVLAADGVSTVIASMKTPAQVAENVGVLACPPLARAELDWLTE